MASRRRTPLIHFSRASRRLTFFFFSNPVVFLFVVVEGLEGSFSVRPSGPRAMIKPTHGQRVAQDSNLVYMYATSVHAGSFRAIKLLLYVHTGYQVQTVPVFFLFLFHAFF